MPTALEQINVNNSQPLNFEDYYQKVYHVDKYGWQSTSNPYGLYEKIQNFWTGDVNSAKQAYNNYLNEFDKVREDNAIQRSFADAQKTGLNPLALISGLGNVSPAASAATYQRSADRSNSRSSSSIVTSALKLLAILALKS